eukprot:jgi/Chrzof1/4971/Cz15g06230.t1
MEVAIKVLQHNSGSAVRVANEVDLMMSFKHPNVVQAYHFVSWIHYTQSSSRSSNLANSRQSHITTDAAEATATAPPRPDDLTGVAATSASGDEVLDAQTWIVQEYCDGGSLYDAARNGSLKQQQADGTLSLLPLIHRLRDIAAAMAYLHSCNIIHCDLKTPNVLLATDADAPYGQTAKVTDFGLSRALQIGQTHRSTRTLGTVTHMAPELLRSGKLSAAADVYSFGIMMWEVFTGEMAFQNFHYGEVIERVALQGERPDVPEHAPEDFALIMTSCWHADPTLRPSFTQVVDCLDIMLAATPDNSQAGSDVGIEADAEAESPHIGQDLGYSRTSLLQRHPSTGVREVLQAPGLMSESNAAPNLPMTPQQGFSRDILTHATPLQQQQQAVIDMQQAWLIEPMGVREPSSVQQQQQQQHVGAGLHVQQQQHVGAGLHVQQQQQQHVGAGLHVQQQQQQHVGAGLHVQQQQQQQHVGAGLHVQQQQQHVGAGYIQQQQPQQHYQPVLLPLHPNQQRQSKDYSAAAATAVPAATADDNSWEDVWPVSTQSQTHSRFSQPSTTSQAYSSMTSPHAQHKVQVGLGHDLSADSDTITNSSVPAGSSQMSTPLSKGGWGVYSGGQGAAGGQYGVQGFLQPGGLNPAFHPGVTSRTSGNLRPTSSTSLTGPRRLGSMHKVSPATPSLSATAAGGAAGGGAAVGSNAATAAGGIATSRSGDVDSIMEVTVEDL